MLRSFANLRRLIHAARVLARHDALVPHEYLSGMPFSIRAARRMLGTREANPKGAAAGVRLARALGLPISSWVKYLRPVPISSAMK